jgi:lipoate-protein ligase A
MILKGDAMLVVINENTSSYFNLAAEEYMLKNYSQDVFMLWRGESSILIGKNQNTLKEINYDFVKENNIDVVRRLSGGGTVFCDMGNTNFTFISNNNTENFSDFKLFTRPILEVLTMLGVDAEFSGRNDLTIDGKKFSGNAQYRDKNRMLHHGTLLFTSDIGILSNAINPSKLKFKGKSVDSVKSRVTNIGAHLKDESIDIIKFRSIINNHILKTNEDACLYKFTDEDIVEINKLVKSKYETYEWNYGKSPKYSSYAEAKFAGGIVEVSYNVEKGKFESVYFSGDFL